MTTFLLLALLIVALFILRALHRLARAASAPERAEAERAALAAYSARMAEAAERFHAAVRETRAAVLVAAEARDGVDVEGLGDEDGLARWSALNDTMERQLEPAHSAARSAAAKPWHECQQRAIAEYRRRLRRAGVDSERVEELVDEAYESAEATLVDPAWDAVRDSRRAQYEG